jgi:hypothetical protein
LTPRRGSLKGVAAGERFMSDADLQLLAKFLGDPRMRELLATATVKDLERRRSSASNDPVATEKPLDRRASRARMFGT